MPERGGPTLQSGVLFQNSVTALYLGELLDASQRLDSKRVTEVRVEARADVDDIVVTFGDGHRVYIQAKEKISRSEAEWENVWRDFADQFARPEFDRTKDRLQLCIGAFRPEHPQTKELCKRAHDSRSYSDWWLGLGKQHQDLAARILGIIGPKLGDDITKLVFLGCVDVQIYPLEELEDTLVRWMPKANVTADSLFHLLRDKVGLKARYRGTFLAPELRKSLLEENITLADPPDNETLRKCVRQSSSRLRTWKHEIGASERSMCLKRSIVDRILEWLLSSTDDDNLGLLLGDAGLGKTVVLREVLCALEEMQIPVIAVKADQQLSGVKNCYELQERLQLPEPLERIMERLGESDLCVLIADQLDALSLSMAQDYAALNTMLDTVARLHSISNVRIILSCRYFDYRNDPRLDAIQTSKTFELAKLRDEEVGQVLHSFGVDPSALAPVTRELLRTPLHLDLFIRMIEDHTDDSTLPPGLGNAASLQELYHILWRQVILKREPLAPPPYEREEALKLIVDYMDRNQTISAPCHIRREPQNRHLEHAISWLESTAIMVGDGERWSFLHATFFDYCYARFFTQRGESLTQVILSSPQGLFQRPQLIQVILYLREDEPGVYLRELYHLLENENLRTHLRILLLRWFGNLDDPTEGEKRIAERLLFAPESRETFIDAIRGKAAWFNRLGDSLIRELLNSRDEALLDKHVLPFLISLLDTQEVQAEVATLLGSFLGRSQRWNDRVASSVLYIHKWCTDEAIDLLERVLARVPTLEPSRIAVPDPETVHCPEQICRFIDILLAHVLRRAIESTSNGLPFNSLANELRDLRSNQFEELLHQVSLQSPKLYIETLMPWFKQAIESTAYKTESHLAYSSDIFVFPGDREIHRVQYALVDSLVDSLSVLAQGDPGWFRTIAADLACLPYYTPQQILARIYANSSAQYATDGLVFFLSDPRRLGLGEDVPRDTAALIKALYPLLSEADRERVEACILAYSPIRKRLGVKALRWRGIEQFCLLQAIPSELLSERAKRSLQEWQRKFPDITISLRPRGVISGSVTSPIPAKAAERMSDRAWLSAMRKYQGGVEHKEAFKGGAEELARVLLGLVREQPERFFHLLNRVPDTVEKYYVTAFLNGLAESQGPSEWLFEAVQRFAMRPERDIRIAVAWALQKRADQGLSDDVLSILEGYLQNPMEEDETHWISEHDGPHSAYLNSVRGSSFQTLMRSMRSSECDQFKACRWELVQFASLDPSDALRVGAIEELLYLLNEDTDRAIRLFSRLMEGHPALLECHYTQEFVYFGLFRDMARMLPFVRAMMFSDKEKCQQWGAELACIAALPSQSAKSSPQQADADKLGQDVMTGPSVWRRGAANVYIHYIAQYPELCAQRVTTLANDEDEQVGNSLGSVWAFLRGEHFAILRESIKTWAAARFVCEGVDHFAKYLFKYGRRDPTWTLTVVSIFLKNDYQVAAQPWQDGIEDIIRAVLQIYHDPTTDNSDQEVCMDLFDILMERYEYHTRRVLAEYDQR